MALPKLFNSFTVYGKDESLKSLLLTLKFGRVEKRISTHLYFKKITETREPLPEFD